MNGIGVAALVVSALVLQSHQIDARTCRSTRIVVEIPNRTKVRVEMPVNATAGSNPSSQQGGNRGQSCIPICSDGICSRCDRNPNYKGRNTNRPPSTTNIFININGKSKDISTAPSNNTEAKGDLFIIQSNTVATSNSSAVANGNKTAAAATSATSITNNDIIASLDDDGGNSSSPDTNNVLIQADSTSSSNSTAHANAGPDLSPESQSNKQPDNDNSSQTPTTTNAEATSNSKTNENDGNEKQNSENNNPKEPKANPASDTQPPVFPDD